MNPSPVTTPHQRVPWTVIVGPTSVGKSAVAEGVALRFGQEIVVADSRQIYLGMDIATNKPTQEERGRVLRHLIDLIPPDHAFSAGAYQKTAGQIIAQIEQQGRPILIEGGCGLYLKALLYGLWAGPAADPSLRETLQGKEKEGGEGTLHRLLGEIDPAASARISLRDIPKLIRALEVFYLTGTPLSAFHEKHRSSRVALGASSPNAVMMGLRRERSDLYQRIEACVDRQISLGLVAETERLLSEGFAPSLPSMQGLGYRQIVPYLRGERTLDEAIALVKRDSRRYAKRQMTWFNADPNIQWIEIKEAEPVETVVDRVLSQYANRLKNR